MSINISAVPNKQRRNGNSILSALHRKQRGMKANQMGCAPELGNAKRLSVPRTGRLPHKKD